MFETGKEYVTTVASVIKYGAVLVISAEGDKGVLRYGALKSGGVFPEHETEDTLTKERIRTYIKELDVIRVKVLHTRAPGWPNLPTPVADLAFSGWF